MAKDKRAWRKLVKKLRRSKIRIAKALSLTVGHKSTAEDLAENMDSDKSLGGQAKATRFSDSLEIDTTNLAEEDDEILHRLEEAAWLERERQAQLEFKMKCAETEKREMTWAAEEHRIRAEWAEKQRIEKEKQEEEERIANEIKKKQEEEFDQFLNFLSGDIENPPLPYIMPSCDGTEQAQPCLYFSRTGACRFGDRCKTGHPKPTLSNTILIQNFFTHFSLDQNLKNFDTDLSLEYENSEMEHDFLEFYEDVLPEFRLCGKVIQFKVCRNFEPHLSGNVYVQYETISEAVQAYRKFNARFYNGKQLSLQFVKIESWNTAICGQFNRNRCQKGRSCNYLHVFRNPTREFVQADRDFVDIKSASDNRHGDRKSESVFRSSRSSRDSSREGRRHRSRSTTRISKCTRRSRSRSRDTSKSSKRFRSRSRSRSCHERSSRRHRSKSSSLKSSHSKRDTTSQSLPESLRAPSLSSSDSNSKLEQIPQDVRAPLVSKSTDKDINLVKSRHHSSKHKFNKSHKKSKKHKKQKKSSKKSKHRQLEDEEADETMSDGSVAVSTPSPRRRC